MALSYEPFEPFDSDQILNISDLPSGDNERWHGFRLNVKLTNDVFEIPDIEEKSLQDVQPITFALDLNEVPIPSLDASSTSYTTAEEDSNSINASSDEEELGDVWSWVGLQDTTHQTALTSWDHFLGKDRKEPVALFLSEAGPAVFDAIISSSEKENPPSLIFQDKLLYCLNMLALGRSSALFRWNETDHQFRPAINDFAISGCTPSLLRHVVGSVVSSGTLMKKLSEPEQFYFQDIERATPSVLAFHSALKSCVTAVHKYLDEQWKDIMTVLGLHQAISSVLPLIDLLDRFTGVVRDSLHDLDLVRRLLQDAAGISLQYQQFTPVLNNIISTIARPVLRDLAREIGLLGHGSPTQSPAFVDEEKLWAQSLPSELFQVFEESRHILHLLPGDFLDTLSVPRSSRDDFELAFTWHGLTAIQTHADDHEMHIKYLLQTPSNVRTNRDFGLRADNSNQSALTLDPFALPNVDSTHVSILKDDPVYTSALDCLERPSTPTSTLHVGYDEVFSLSILPFLSNQHRLLSYLVFRLSFERRKLLSHVKLQRRIQLLGDWAFATRLKTALFDPEQYSGESRRQIGATVGLRLQTRDTWPPASSELRIVLMGILSDSLDSASDQPVKDTISFAIRDLADDELDRCREVNSIHALDFLKVQYRAPDPVIEAVISPESLDKYDRIFKHLLLILRLQSVSQALLRSVSNRNATTDDIRDQRFHFELHQFLSALAHYSQNIAVQRPWAEFENRAIQIESKVHARDYDGVLSAGHSLRSLQTSHEAALDSILNSLFLKTRHSHVLNLIHEIFEVILKYAAGLRKHEGDSATKERHHNDFSALVKRLVNCIRDAIQAGRHRNRGHELTDEFLVHLDLNGFWAR